MAIDYTELFTDIGKNVKAVNQFHDSSRSLGLSLPNFDALLAEIQARYESQSLQRLIEGLESTYAGYRDTSSSWASQQSDRAQQRLLDRDTVVNELAGADVGDIDRTIREIFRDMDFQTDSINKSVVVIGAPSADAGNTGNGSVRTTDILDGVTPPSPGFGSFLLYDGLETALSVPSELMTFTCIADEDTDGTPAGHEIFLWEGQPATNGTFGWKTEGSGVSLQLSTTQAAETLSNRDLEAWDGANSPINWPIESGIPGTEIIEEQAAANVHRGTSSMRLVGTGTDVRLIQELPTEAGSFLVPNQQLYYMVFIKTLGDVAGGGVLTIRMESPSGDYVASSSEEIVINETDLNSKLSFTLSEFYLPVPSSIPEDLRWVIRFEGATAGNVFIDSMGLAPVNYANGIGITINAGRNNFARNDRFTLQVDNTEGIFSQFFRRRFLFQLPQSVTPSIPDSLAQ